MPQLLRNARTSSQRYATLMLLCVALPAPRSPATRPMDLGPRSTADLGLTLDLDLRSEFVLVSVLQPGRVALGPN